MNLNGPNALIAVEGPTDGVRVAIDSASTLIAAPTLAPSDGASARFASVTLAGNVPSGVYCIRVTQDNGREVATIGVRWDAATKQFALVEAMDAYQPATSLRDDGSLSNEDLFARALAGETADANAAQDAVGREALMSALSGATVTSGVLDGPWIRGVIEQQRGDLLGRVSGLGGAYDFFVDGQEFQTLFYRAFPQWSEANRAQTMRAMRKSWRSFDYARQSELNKYHKWIPHYNNDVGTMVAAGLNALLAARRGDDPAPFLSQARAIEGKSTGILGAIGLRYPSVLAVLEGCGIVLTQQTGELVAAQELYAGQVNRQTAKFIRGHDWAGSGAASLSANQQAERDRTHQHNLAVILGSEGIGTPAERAAKHMIAYPEAIPAAAGMPAEQVAQVRQELGRLGASGAGTLLELKRLSRSLDAEATAVTDRVFVAMAQGTNLHGAAGVAASGQETAWICVEGTFAQEVLSEADWALASELVEQLTEEFTTNPVAREVGGYAVDVVRTLPEALSTAEAMKTPEGYIMGWVWAIDTGLDIGISGAVGAAVGAAGTPFGLTVPGAVVGGVAGHYLYLGVKTSARGGVDALRWFIRGDPVPSQLMCVPTGTASGSSSSAPDSTPNRPPALPASGEHSGYGG